MFLVLALVAAQTPDPSTAFIPVRDRMSKFVADGEVAGMVTLVGRREAGPVHVYVGGYADLEAKRKMEPDTIFRIASMTKPVTALAVMMLADEGKLSPDDPVEKHLPEFKGQMLVAGREGKTVTLKPPARPITLRDLMTHTSGLPAYPPGLADVYVKRNHTLAETTVAISQRPLEFEPGSKWSYCNPGIDTLGRLVEVASGMPYHTFVQKRILDPLAMRDTTFYPTAEQLARTAVTYGKKNGKLVATPGGILDYVRDAKHPVPAGGLFSTAGDLAKLYRMCLGRGVIGDTRLLSDKAFADMTRVQTGELKTGFVDGMGFGYGFGVVREPKGVTAALAAGSFGHGGAFGTQGWIDPTNDVFYILLIQRTGLANGDASAMRGEFQRLASEALK